MACLTCPDILHSMQYMKALLVIREKEVREGFVVERVVWQLSAPLPGCVHPFKYRLYFGRGGKTVVRYDNESGKGDHRHAGHREHEAPYAFTSLESLMADFEMDVRKAME